MYYSCSSCGRQCDEDELKRAANKLKMLTDDAMKYLFQMDYYFERIKQFGTVGDILYYKGHIACESCVDDWIYKMEHLPIPLVRKYLANTAKH